MMSKPKSIDVVYEDGVFKPLAQVELEEGKRVTIRVEATRVRRLGFEPIKLTQKITVEKLKELKMDRWSPF
jgi:predicted DNA-binding antitoxin AbrB/MazE fold protein